MAILQAPSKERFLESLYSKLEAPYIEGGRGSKGYDCINLLICSLESAGYKFEYKKTFSHNETTLWLQYIDQIAFITQSPEPSDIIVNNRFRIPHFAVYIGDNQIIHCHPKYGKVLTHYIDDNFLYKSTIYRLRDG